jgi:hypothetical protein
MERRRGFLGWLAIGLGVLVLLGVVSGMYARHSFGDTRSVAVVQEDQRGGWPDQGGWGMRQRGAMPDGPRGMVQGDPRDMMPDGPRGMQGDPRDMMRDDPRGMQDGPRWHDERGTQDGPRWQDEPGNGGFRAVPPVPAQPPLPPQVGQLRVRHGGPGFFGGIFFLLLKLLGSIVRFALFAAVAYAVVRWLQRREARRNQDPPAQPPHTSDTQSL